MCIAVPFRSSELTHCPRTNRWRLLKSNHRCSFGIALLSLRQPKMLRLATRILVLWWKWAARQRASRSGTKLGALAAATRVVSDSAYKGTRLSLELTIAIDKCEACKIHNLLCQEGTGLMHGFSTAGHFADYSVSDYRNAMVLPDGIDMVSAAPLF